MFALLWAYLIYFNMDTTTFGVVKKIFSVTLVAVFMLSFSTSFAREKNTGPNSDSSVEAKREELQNKRLERRTLVEVRKEEFKTERQEKIEQRKLEFQEKLEARLEEKAENLANHLNSLNDVLTDNYLKHLDKLEDVLDKILVRVEAMENERGLDLSSVREAAGTARSEIDTARDAVFAQKEKVYTAVIQNRQDLGPTIREMMAEFKQDHVALRDILKDARRAVVDVLGALKDELSEFNDKKVGESASGEE